MPCVRQSKSAGASASGRLEAIVISPADRFHSTQFAHAAAVAMPAFHVEPGRNVELHRKQDAIKNPLLLFERRVERVCVNRACTELLLE